MAADAGLGGVGGEIHTEEAHKQRETDRAQREGRQRKREGDRKTEMQGRTERHVSSAHLQSQHSGDSLESVCLQSETLPNKQNQKEEL